MLATRNRSETIGSVVQYLNLLDFNYYNHVEIFRGHANSEWQLSPSIERFSKQAGYIGYGGRNWIELENLLLNTFKKESIPYMSFLPENKLEWLVHAQHHGLPTTLLDWTTNPLKGLFFAVEDTRYDSHDGSVFFGNASFYETDEILSKSDYYLYCFLSKHINERIIAQEGCFSLYPFPKDFDPFIRLSEIEESEKADLWLSCKVIIPNDTKSKIRRELAKLGITKKALFPGIDSIADSIKQKY